MEEQDFGYQTEPEVTEEVSTEPIESNEPTEEAQPQAEAEEFDEIKYNKESVKIPASERQKLLQMGYHYQNKVQGEYEALRQKTAHLDELARKFNLESSDQLIQKMREAEQKQQQEEYERQQTEHLSRQLGVEPEYVKRALLPLIMPLQNKLTQYEQREYERQYERTQEQINNEVSQLRSKYQDFDKYMDPVFDMAINRGYSLEEAYRLASYEDRMNNISKQTEQEVLARVTGRDEKQVLSSSDKPTNTKLDVASMSFDDIEALHERVMRGEKIQL